MDIGFKYYLVVFLTVSLISVGIILLKNPFFIFANATANLLDSFLERKHEGSHKQRKLLESFGNLLPKLGILLFFLALTLGVSIIPVVVYLEYNPEKSVRDLDLGSVYFFISVILGSVALFIVPLANRSRDSFYSGWSMLLHRMILENYNISSALFRLEKKLFKKKLDKPLKDFVIVTGLEKGGTATLTNLLSKSNRFHSLSHEFAPFLLAVNLWHKRHPHRKNKLEDNAPANNFLFGYNTIESLEEYFFKVFLKDAYISDDTLLEHELSEELYVDYLNYQKLICPKGQDSLYLAKNNNLILRYSSMRSHHPEFKILLMFRSPLEHAYSMLTEHNRFSDMHETDPFSLEYMTWLGHYEFGLNHKVFQLERMNLRDSYDISTISYWIAIWISYYTHIIHLLEDKNLFLIEYADLCEKPNELLATLGILLNLDLSAAKGDPFVNRELKDLDPDEELLKEALEIYENLKQNKVQIT